MISVDNKPIDSVRAVIFPSREEAFRNEGLFFVVQEDDDVGVEKLPGGQLDDGETPDEAMWREVAEELKLLPGQVTLTFVAQRLNDDGVSQRYLYVGWVLEGGTALPGEHIISLTLENEATIPETAKNFGHIRTAAQAGRLALASVTNG